SLASATLKTDSERAAFLLQQIHALNLSIHQARRRGDTGTVDRLTELRRSAERERAVLVARLARSEQPVGGAIVRGVDQLVAGAGRAVGGVVRDVAQAARSFGGWILIVLVLVIVTLYLYRRRTA
ncbi:MAG: hypothetical protein ACREMV_15095, partial [Gemmatimonadales bacterium]